MRKADGSNGFLKCFLMNLVFHSGWAAAAVVLFILYLWLGFPWILSQLALGVWLLMSFGLTCLVSWGNKSSSERLPPPPNKNPYSASTAALLAKAGKQNVLPPESQLTQAEKVIDVLKITPMAQEELKNALRASGDPSPENLLTLMAERGLLFAFSGEQGCAEVVQGFAAVTQAVGLLPPAEIPEAAALRGLSAAAEIASKAESWCAVLLRDTESRYCGMLADPEDRKEVSGRMQAYFGAKFSVIPLDGPQN